MVLMPLAVVESWQAAINARDLQTLAALTAHDIELGGLTRAGFMAESTRWFCGANGAVVVEQRARWSLLAGERTLASAFVVRGGRVTRYERFDDLDTALAAVALSEDDEVIPPRA